MAEAAHLYPERAAVRGVPAQQDRGVRGVAGGGLAELPEVLFPEARPLPDYRAAGRGRCAAGLAPGLPRHGAPGPWLPCGAPQLPATAARPGSPGAHGATGHPRTHGGLLRGRGLGAVQSRYPAAARYRADAAHRPAALLEADAAVPQRRLGARGRAHRTRRAALAGAADQLLQRPGKPGGRDSPAGADRRPGRPEIAAVQARRSLVSVPARRLGAARRRHARQGDRHLAGTGAAGGPRRCAPHIPDRGFPVAVTAQPVEEFSPEGNHRHQLQPAARECEQHSRAAACARRAARGRGGLRRQAAQPAGRVRAGQYLLARPGGDCRLRRFAR